MDLMTVKYISWYSEEALNTVGMFTCLFLFYGSPLLGLGLTLYLIATPAFPLVLLYLTWIYMDRQTAHRQGRSIEWLRSLKLFHYFRSYFPHTVVKTADLPSSQNYLLCLFPHGVLCTGVFSQFAPANTDFSRLFPDIQVTVHTLNFNFYCPFSREYILASVDRIFTMLREVEFCREENQYLANVDNIQRFRSVSSEAISHNLSEQGRGHASLVVVGGSAEALLSSPGTHRVVLRNRKGFVRLAITTGASLVPIYMFGETDLYRQWIFPRGSLMHRFQEAVRRLTGVAPCLALGRGILPFAKPVTIVVGKPIEVEKNDSPTVEEVNRLHGTFSLELVALFDKHKHRYLPHPETTFLTIQD